MHAGDAVVTSQSSERSGWEMARRRAHPVLAEHVAGYCGYREWSLDPFRRREAANGHVVLIVGFGDSIDVEMPGSGERAASHRSFVAGMHAGFALTEYTGHQGGVQIDLTPIGAYRLLGIPMCEIANQVVALDALDIDAERLAEQLADAPDWTARLDLAERWLLERVADGPEVASEVAWSWGQLVRSHGLVAIGELAHEIGWSARHFADRFRTQIGLNPKIAARVLRFRRAVGSLEAGAERSIADVAATSGYADHSHLVRDFQEFAGVPPSAYRAAQLPGSGGVGA